jgi:EmrB/QacA subfamily drug resistance transporter
MGLHRSIPLAAGWIPGMSALASEPIDRDVVKLGAILTSGALAVVFDTTIVSVALRILATELEVSVATIQWVTTGYVLALGMAVPLSTWALERFGGRRTWISSLALFLVASIGSALAWDAASLIAWRVVQGIGGGLLMPTMGTLVMRAAAGRAVGRTVSIAMLPLTAGPIVGPLVGGVVLTHLSWRFMFWINVPLCLVGLVLAWIFLPIDPTARKATRFDTVGFLLLAPAIAGLLLGLTNAGRLGRFGDEEVLVPGLTGVVLVALFGVHALSRDEPLVDLRLLRHRSLAAASAVLFFNAVAIYGPLLLLPIYYLEGRGASPLSAGAILVPEAIGTAIGLGAAGRLTDRLGPRQAAVAATVLVTLATVPFVFATARTSGVLLAVWLLLRGIGLGAVGVPAMTSAYRGLARAEIGHSTVLTRTVVQVGGALGTALLAVFLVRATTVHGQDIVSAVNTAFGCSVVFGAAAVAVALLLPGEDRVVTQRHRGGSS